VGSKRLKVTNTLAHFGSTRYFKKEIQFLEIAAKAVGKPKMPKLNMKVQNIYIRQTTLKHKNTHNKLFIETEKNLQ
jgi:hypothetical protein